MCATPPKSEPVERFLLLECAGETSLGVVALPGHPGAQRDLGVLIVVGGPQYRVGSQRQFVQLARALARAGYPVLRFDYRGMGDSDGEHRTFESIDEDLKVAIATLQRETGVARVVLWGLCDGASAALMHGEDRAIAGIVAVNPWARSPHGEAATRLRHYYLARLFSWAFWRKVWSGKFDLRRSAGEVASTVRSVPGDRSGPGDPPYLERMHEGWARFGNPVLFILSGRDLTAREFEGWVARDRRRKRLLAKPSAKLLPFADADHTFSTGALQDALSVATIDWIRDIATDSR